MYDAIITVAEEKVDISVDKECKIKDLGEPLSFNDIQTERKGSNLFLFQPKIEDNDF